MARHSNADMAEYVGDVLVVIGRGCDLYGNFGHSGAHTAYSVMQALCDAGYAVKEWPYRLTDKGAEAYYHIYDEPPNGWSYRDFRHIKKTDPTFENSVFNDLLENDRQQILDAFGQNDE